MLDSLQIVTKGTASTRLRIELRRDTQVTAMGVYMMPVGSTWTQEIVHPDDFIVTSDDSSIVTWDEFSIAVNRINIVAEDTTGSEFWLDEIRLYGVVILDLLQ